VVVEAEKSKIKTLAFGESLLVTSFHGRRQKGMEAHARERER
jgi:hypothetical protein